MTLKERFQQWFINGEASPLNGMVELVSIEHERLAGLFAIEFAEWCIFNEVNKSPNYSYKKLLEIYKKEKGL